MTDKHKLQAMLDRVTDGTIAGPGGPEILAAMPRETWPHIVAANSGSLDAAVAFVQSTLPGWAWRVAECSVSSDAWVFPDFNSPTHGERLAREFPQLIEGVEWSEFTDVDLRPAGNPARALLIAALTALIAVALLAEKPLVDESRR